MMRGRLTIRQAHWFRLARPRFISKIVMARIEEELGLEC
jgi:hypothetical protein